MVQSIYSEEQGHQTPDHKIDCDNYVDLRSVMWKVGCSRVLPIIKAVKCASAMVRSDQIDRDVHFNYRLETDVHLTAIYFDESG